MKSGKAFRAGVLAGLAVSVVLSVLRRMGVDVNLPLLLGTLFGTEISGGTWVFGALLHLLISGLIAMIYAWAFERIAKRAGWDIGVGFGVVHALIGGLALLLIPAIHPMVPEEITAPGAFFFNRGGAAFFSFILVHLIYGALVGALYARPEHEEISHHDPHRHRYGHR